MACAVFWPLIGCGFLTYDDPLYVTDNPHVWSGLNAAGVKWAWGSFYASNWHPLTWLSHMLDCELFGLNPAGHHLGNILIHGLNTALVFLLFRRLTGAVGGSLFVAGCFGLHPAHVQSVAWIAERKDVLSGSFFLLSLWAYAAYGQSRARSSQPAVHSPQPKVRTLSAGNSEARGPKPQPGAGEGYSLSSIFGPRSRFWYWLALCFFGLGLLSKPMLVTLPFVLLVLDFWPLGRAGQFGSRDLVAQKASPGLGAARVLRAAWKLALEKAPFFLLSAGASAITFVAQQKGGAVETLARLPFFARIEDALAAYLAYLGKLVWPENLAIYYPPRSPSAPLALTSLGLWLALIAAGWFLRRRCPYLLAGLLWFLGMLVPVIGLVQVGTQFIADRYTYLPSLGIFLIVAWAIPDLVSVNRWPALRALAPAAALLVMIACVVRTRQELPYWRNSGAVFQHALAVTDHNAIAHLHFGNYALQNRNVDEAIPHFREALAIEPGLSDAYGALGTALQLKGLRQEAMRCLQQALALKPDYPEAHFNLGAILQAQAQVDEAIPHFQRAIELKPHYAEAYSGLGVALQAKGRTNEALAFLQRAVELKPDFPTAHYNLALVLLLKGDVQGARWHFAEAVRLRPGYAEAQARLRALPDAP